MTKEKPQIPPDHVLLEDAARILKDSGYDITYNGLYYYRRLGILPAPERLPNSKFKYYKIYDLVEVMFVVDFLRGIFHLNMEGVASLIKGSGLDNVRSLIKVYFMSVDLAMKMIIPKTSESRGDGNKELDQKGTIEIIRQWTEFYENGINAIANTDRKILEKYSKSDYLKAICNQPSKLPKRDKILSAITGNVIMKGILEKK